MIFGAIQYLWVLLFLPLVWFILTYGDRKRRETLQQYAEIPLWKYVVLRLDSRKVLLKRALLLGAVLLMAFSFLQPKWGYHWEEVKRRGVDVLIALDLSKSMLAEDVKPNRLRRAQLEIKNFISRLEGDRVGLIGFAGTAFLQCPLTLDYATAKIFLDVMEPDLIPEPGTDLGAAIQTAFSAFESVDKKHRVLILITDGEDHEARALSIVEKAREKGVIIHTISVGSQVGAPVPVTDDAGQKSYLKDETGKVVLTKTDPEVLQKIALLTGGRYGNMGGAASPLDEIYEQEIAKMEKKDLDSTRQKKYENRYQWPLALALVCLVMELLLSVRKKEDSEVLS